MTLGRKINIFIVSGVLRLPSEKGISLKRLKDFMQTARLAKKINENDR